MSMAAAGISSGLAGIVGTANVITEPAQLSVFRVNGITPQVAARPGSNQEVAEVVRLAAAEKLALVPVGARTKLGMNIPLRQYELALDMTRFDRVVAYDPDDLTLSVEPGIPLCKLAEALAAHRQFLPLAVPFMSRATVGGTIASGVDSALRQFYGTARDYVLGMEFVTGDGQLVKSGGRVVKNVSGYDLHKLMIGSLGSLGVITKVNFRTFPAPASTGAFVAYFDSARDAVGMRQSIAQSPLRPLTMEILSPRADELLSSSVATQIEPRPPLGDTRSKSRWVFVVSYTGTERVLERYERDLRQIAGGADVTVIGEDAAAVALGRVREFIPIALESSPATVIVKMSVLPGKISELVDDAASAAEKACLPWAAMARGVGVIYFALLPSTRNEDTRAHVGRFIEELIDACQRQDGNFTVPWYPHERKGAMPTQKTRRSDLELMRKLKPVFDPGGIFALDPLAAWT